MAPTKSVYARLVHSSKFVYKSIISTNTWPSAANGWRIRHVLGGRLAITMKLYDLAGAEDDLRFSPNCWRIKMALEHKGLAAETVPWRFVEKDVIAFSGQKAVPVLVDGEKVVSDSWEIARYLEHAYSDKPSLFGGPAGEGLALFVKFWCEQTLNRVILRLILPDLFRCLHEKDKAYFRESREARFGTTLEQYALPSAAGVPLLRDALSPLRAILFQRSDLVPVDSYCLPAPTDWYPLVP